MPKPKPKWGLDAGWGMMVPSLSSDFCHKVSEVLTLSGKELDQYLDGLKSCIDLYRSRKEEEKDKPTDGQVMQAALAIKKQSQELAKMLDGDAGGVRPYIDHPLLQPLKHSHGVILLEHFSSLLDGIEKGCDGYLENIYPNLNNYKVPRIKSLFARDVMEHYITFFGKEPKTTLPLDCEGGASMYAQILQAGFSECDNDIPSDGDLKKIMSWALNNRKD